MPISQSPRNDDRHPFAGCSRLLDQYQQVGRALLAYEGRVGGALIPVHRYVRDFHFAVAFVPVEVLESYLDDLLDLGVCDDSLFIKKSRLSKRALALFSLGVIALSAVLWFGREGEQLMSVPALVMVAFLAGLGSALYFLPRTKVLRRFSFATLVSREIAARRGHDKTSMGDFATRLLSREFWIGRASGARVGNMPPAPARVVLRQYH